MFKYKYKEILSVPKDEVKIDDNVNYDYLMVYCKYAHVFNVPIVNVGKKVLLKKNGEHKPATKRLEEYVKKGKIAKSPMRYNSGMFFILAIVLYYSLGIGNALVSLDSIRAQSDNRKILNEEKQYHYIKYINEMDSTYILHFVSLDKTKYETFKVMYNVDQQVLLLKIKESPYFINDNEVAQSLIQLKNNPDNFEKDTSLVNLSILRNSYKLFKTQIRNTQALDLPAQNLMVLKKYHKTNVNTDITIKEFKKNRRRHLDYATEKKAKPTFSNKKTPNNSSKVSSSRKFDYDELKRNRGSVSSKNANLDDLSVTSKRKFVYDGADITTASGVKRFDYAELKRLKTLKSGGTGLKTIKSGMKARKAAKSAKAAKSGMKALKLFF